MSETMISNHNDQIIEIFPRNYLGLHPVEINGKRVAKYLLKHSWVDSLFMARERIDRKALK